MLLTYEYMKYGKRKNYIAKMRKKGKIDKREILNLI
jgi:hypothetical protein